MNLDAFMIWRFKNVEGVLDNIKSWNLDSCLFTDGSSITYSLKDGYLTIDKNLKKTSLKFEECSAERLIGEFGFKERQENRHELSFKEKN